MRYRNTKKIPTIFLRDPDNMKLVTRNPNPECQWVFDGEGVATRTGAWRSLNDETSNDAQAKKEQATSRY